MMLADKYHYIAIEGPIGSGKTTLANRLARRLSAQVLLEEPQTNPFLPSFYKDPVRYALPTQLFFLFQRADQIKNLSQRDLFQTHTISDFLFQKDQLFAKLNLNQDELSLYQNIYQHLHLQVPSPDLVIYLQAPISTLTKRVAQRNLDYEQPITTQYLTDLSDTYNHFFHHYQASPLLIINNDNLDYSTDESALELLIHKIETMKSMREYFNIQD